MSPTALVHQELLEQWGKPSRIVSILKDHLSIILTEDYSTVAMTQSIDIYNYERPHWSCWMNTPAFMHQQETIKIKTYKTKNSTEIIPDAI